MSLAETHLTDLLAAFLKDNPRQAIDHTLIMWRQHAD
jgi:hypothetical protein